MAGADTPDLAAAARAGGADLVEIGFPFSDPLADGPVIRRAAEKALAAGMRTRACLECLAATRARVQVPLVPMTYSSILEAYGWDRFAEDARANGAESLIVADLPAGDRAEPPPHPARRADLDRRAGRPRRGGDRRLALPRHADRDDRRARRPLPRARRPRRACPPRAPRSRSTPASASRRPEHARAAAELVDGDRRRLARGRGRRGRPGGARALCQLVEGRDLNYRFEQLTPSCWAAVALDTGAAIGNAGIARHARRRLRLHARRAGRELRAQAGTSSGCSSRHADFDHYGGAQAFADLPILASEQTAQTIREVGPGRVAGMKEQMESYIAELEEKARSDLSRLA